MYLWKNVKDFTILGKGFGKKHGRIIAHDAALSENKRRIS